MFLGNDTELHAGGETLIEPATELLDFIATRCRAQFAVARIDGWPSIVSKGVWQTNADERLTREAGEETLVDSSGRFRGTLSIVAEDPRELAGDWRDTLHRGATLLMKLIESADQYLTCRKDRDAFRALLEDSAVAMYSIRNDRFSYVNAKFAEAVGYSKDELLALKSVADIVPLDDRANVAEMIRQRQSGEMRELHYVAAIQRRDGTLMDAEIHGSTTDIDGERLAIGAAIDVTGRQIAERRLRDREEYFRVLTENIADVICIINEDGLLNYLTNSIETILGYKVEERLGRLAFETANAEDRERLWSRLQRLAPGARLEPCQLRVRHKNGSWRILEVHGTNLLDHPQISGYVMIASDITGRRRLEQELEQLNRLSSLGRLSAQIAHEFNNVLMGMQPAVDVIRRRYADDAQSSRLTEMMAMSIARGKRITSDILRFGRPAQLSLKSVNAREFVSRIGDEIKPLLPVGTELRMEISPSTPYVKADAVQLAQCLINVALNARDAMHGRDGTLTLGVGPGSDRTAKAVGDLPNSDQFVHFSVSDTGEGIGSEDLPYIFEPLFTTKKTGTGLGLSVVYQVVAAHGGHLFVDTERDRGTTFHLFIPAADDPVLDAETNDPVSAATRKLRVLIVEDEIIIATGLRWILESEGMAVQVANNAADAIPAVNEFKPDVIVLDLTLPDADGRTVYKELKPRKIPVIFSTGSVAEQELVEGSDDRVAVLLKPYTSDELIRAIHKVTIEN